MSAPASRVDVLLVVGGRYHDFDFALRELLALLAEHDHVRTRVESTYENIEALDGASVIVSDHARSHEMGTYTDFIVLTR